MKRLRNLRLLRSHPSYRKRAVVSVLAYLGALATVLEVLERTAGDPYTAYANNLWVVVGLAVVGATAVFVVTLPSDRYRFVHGSFRADITIEVGDLLTAHDDVVVLTANRHFDSVPANRHRGGAGRPVADGSLIAQVGRRWFPAGDGYDLARMIDASGATSGNDHPVGTTVELHHPAGNRIVLLAVSSRDQQKLSAVLIDDIWSALSQLWAYARRTGPRSLALPVIGSGYANTEVGPNPLLMLLITSYVTAAMESPICPIRIVLPREAHDLSAFELAQSYCQSLGFKTHR
jgi:hypothetical protein